MPKTVVSDIEAVVQLANDALSETPHMRREDAAAKALRHFYKLAPRDGIWGGSEAANNMGYRGHLYEEDLFYRIVVDVAAQLP